MPDTIIVVVLALILIFLLVVPFTGIPIKNNEGTYKGYVTAVEKNGAIFKGWNVYLKTELESSNEDKACINRDDESLIKRLQEAMESKENIALRYEGVIAYKIGVCPDSKWMIVEVIE